MIKNDQKTCLFIGDGGVSTGFANMNHHYINGLLRGGWRVVMLALNYWGDPHQFKNADGSPLEIYPTKSLYGGDWLGLSRIGKLINQIGPHLVHVTNDPWHIQKYLREIGNTGTVGSIAVDGKNCRGTELNGLKQVVFWTQFGLNEARLGGYTGPAAVIPLGVDVEIFKPMDQGEARYWLGLGQLKDKFIIGAVGRNQPRKRLDLTLLYFAEWIKSRKIQDAYLYVHTAPTGDVGFDLEQLAYYLGISNRFICPYVEQGHGSSQAHLMKAYNTMDVLLSTSTHEGWGLCPMEAMSCGVPVISGDHSALGEWPENNIFKVPCSSWICTDGNVNAIGGILDKEETLKTLDMCYEDRNYAKRAGRDAHTHVNQPQFRWEYIGDRYCEVMDSVLYPQRVEVSA